MWTAIALENAAAIEGALRQTEREIATLRDSIKRADQEDLRRRFEAARLWYEGSGKRDEGSGAIGGPGLEAVGSENGAQAQADES
jgi:hypothetical protein